jgi:epithelial splicing regulatory protein 1/2
LGIEDFHLVTDGCLHLRQSLIPECTKKDIKLPDYYYSYYDIRKEFLKYTGLNQKINNLDDINNCNYFLI